MEKRKKQLGRRKRGGIEAEERNGKEARAAILELSLILMEHEHKPGSHASRIRFSTG